MIPQSSNNAFTVLTNKLQPSATYKNGKSSRSFNLNLNATEDSNDGEGALGHFSYAVLNQLQEGKYKEYVIIKKYSAVSDKLQNHQ